MTGEAADGWLDAVLADACHPDCAAVWARYGRHAPNCQGDVIRELVAEVRRLRQRG